MQEESAFLKAENISKAFPLKGGARLAALDSVSLAVRRGGITALVGPDGGGKTTTLRIIAGLLAPDSGSLFLEGDAWPNEHVTPQEVTGYMPQKFGLYEDLTVQENLDLYADLRGLDHAAREARYRELLSMSGMSPFRERLAGKLSGGMKQKLGLICTLARPPKLLLLDEPTVGVDPLSRRELWQMVENLAKDGGMSVIVSTSYLDEAARCDEVVLLFEGQTLARDTPQAVRKLSEGMAYMAVPTGGDTPRSLQARLLDAPGIIDAVPQGGAVRFVHAGLSPEQASLIASCLGGAVAKPVPASLEDSFMMLLRDHVRQQPEPFATVPSPARVSGPARENGAAGDGPVIRTNHVSRLFGDFIAVNDVSFSVGRGEVFGLLGPNGAGKTTTFRMLCGLLPASKGELYVAGVNVREAREEARRHLGYVAQKFSLYGPLSVRENLDFFAGAYGLAGGVKKDRISRAVADFSLEGHLDMPAQELPGGYKQRLAMAVGLLHDPAILFLDEPTSGADPLARRGFWKRIAALAETGVTIVVTTHFMEEAEYCDRVLIQDRGVMLALDTPANIRALADPGAGQAATMEDAFIAIVEKGRRDNREAA